jgi:hypothetical protein
MPKKRDYENPAFLLKTGCFIGKIGLFANNKNVVFLRQNMGPGCYVAFLQADLHS